MTAEIPGLLDKERIIAGPGYNRWLVPPAALAIHLCIGMAYGFSVFWLPLSKALGIKEAIKCGPDVGFWAQLFVTTCDWQISTLGWMYTLFLSCWAPARPPGAVGWSAPDRARPGWFRPYAGAAAC